MELDAVTDRLHNLVAQRASRETCREMVDGIAESRMAYKILLALLDDCEAGTAELFEGLDRGTRH